VILLGGITWRRAHQLDSARALNSSMAPLDIQVVSLDWKWLFIYPGADAATLTPRDIEDRFEEAAYTNGLLV
jgi:cytochrome o ubiquinol oxidase subunit 2